MRNDLVVAHVQEQACGALWTLVAVSSEAR